nr:SMC-Scp complex subunit ScpB [Sulfobacillus harzensis]
MDLLEALLFVHGDPVSVDQLALWLDLPSTGVEQQLQALDEALQSRQSGLSVQRVAGGVRLTTHPRLQDALAARLGRRAPEPLSHAAWEVLAIVAYRQPITRLEIEAIRQTGSERALDTLLNRELIEEVGRKEAPGRPILYGTTARFLREFGLDSPSDLPPLSVGGETTSSQE